MPRAPLAEMLAVDMAEQPRDRRNLLRLVEHMQRGADSIGDLLRPLTVVVPGGFHEGIEIHHVLASKSAERCLPGSANVAAREEGLCAPARRPSPARGSCRTPK